MFLKNHIYSRYYGNTLTKLNKNLPILYVFSHCTYLTNFYKSVLQNLFVKIIKLSYLLNKYYEVVYL